MVTLISPFEKGREQARKICHNFMEVYVKADVAECIKRDPKKLYAKALAGDIRNFTGIDSPYEEPKNPNVVLDTVNCTPDECVNQLIDAIILRLKGGKDEK